MTTTLIALAVVLAAYVAVVLAFRLHYIKYCLMAIEDCPWLKASSCDPLEDREDCEFLTSDGLTLRGSYLPTPARERRGVILACHELNGDRWGILPYVQRLRTSGYDVFTFDFRNHGASDSTPGYQPNPWLTDYELVDLEAALTYLARRADVDPPGVGAVGVSRGGVAALCAAGAHPQIRAVAVDGAYPRLSLVMHFVKRYMGIFTPFAPVFEWVPGWYFKAMMGWTMRVAGARRGVRYVATERYLARVHQPALLIHGAEDGYIPEREAQVVRQTLGGEVEWWLAPGVRHNRAVFEAPDYQQRIVDFFDRRLAGRPVESPEEVTEEASAEQVLAGG